MKKLDDSIVGVYEKFLLYGAGGTSKTWTSGTMPGPVYHLMFGVDSELITLRSPAFKARHPDKLDHHYHDVVFENVGAGGMFKSADGYDDAMTKLDELEAQDEVDFQSIVIDATGLSEFAMNKAIEVGHFVSKDTTKTAMTRLKEMNIIIPGDNDWKSEMSLMFRFMARVVKLPYHVCVIAHEWKEESIDRATRKHTISDTRPLFVGKNRENIPRMFSSVWHFSVEGKGRGQKFLAQTQRDDIIYARTRFGGLLPNTMSDVDMTEVINKFHEEARKS